MTLTQLHTIKYRTNRLWKNNGALFFQVKFQHLTTSTGLYQTVDTKCWNPTALFT